MSELENVKKAEKIRQEIKDLEDQVKKKHAALENLKHWLYDHTTRKDRDLLENFKL